MRPPNKAPRPAAGGLGRAAADGQGGASTCKHTANPASLQARRPRRVPRRFVAKQAGRLSSICGLTLVFTRRAAAAAWGRAHFRPGMFAVRNPFTDELVDGYVLMRERQ